MSSLIKINTFASRYGSDIDCFTGVMVPCSSDEGPSFSFSCAWYGSPFLQRHMMVNIWRCCPESFRTFVGGPLSSTRRNLLHLMHRKEQLYHSFHQKVWEMAILLSMVQFGSHIYSSVPGWVWSAPVYVRAILMKGAGLREQRTNPVDVTHACS